MISRVTEVSVAKPCCKITAEARVVRNASRYLAPAIKAILPSVALSKEAIAVIVVSPSPKSSAPIATAMSLHLRETEVTKVPD